MLLETVAGLLIGVLVATPAGAQRRDLAGSEGPRIEMIGSLPSGHELLEARVYASPDDPPVDAAAAPRFPADTARLKLDVLLNRLPREGMRLHYDLATRTGAVPLADSIASFNRLPSGAATRVEFELVPKTGRFASGPYRLTFSMDDRPVFALNFAVREK